MQDPRKMLESRLMERGGRIPQRRLKDWTAEKNSGFLGASRANIDSSGGSGTRRSGNIILWDDICRTDWVHFDRMIPICRTSIRTFLGYSMASPGRIRKIAGDNSESIMFVQSIDYSPQSAMMPNGPWTAYYAA